MRTTLATKCPACKQEVGAFIPKGGDGSAVRPRRHKSLGEWCGGSWDITTDFRVVPVAMKRRTRR